MAGATTISIRSCGLLGLLLVLYAAWPASAEAGTRREAPGVIVSFQGGLVGPNVATVLEALAKSPEGVPKLTHVVGRGETLCGILESRNFPRDCARLAAFVDTLNPSTRPSQRGLKYKDELILPNVELAGYRAVNNYSRSIVEQNQRGQEVSQAWREHGARQIDRSPEQITVEYKAYELYIPMKSDEAATALASRLLPLRSPNVFINVLRNSPRQLRLNSYSAAEAEKFCLDGTIGTRIYNYGSLAHPDRDAEAAMRKALPREPRQVNVTLIDVALAASPNLWPSFGSAEPSSDTWSCKWRQFVAGHHHATHLASIIASQHKTFGFIGLAPHVRLESFEWVVPNENGSVLAFSKPDVEFTLADQFQAGEVEPPPLRVYLAATIFEPPLSDAGPEAVLADENMRFGSRLPATVRSAKPLLIAAAGQAGPDEAPVEIGPRTNLSPQNLGDRGSVVVVTACEDCTATATARLLPAAHSSRKGENFVHVAAPGGAMVPGWITPEHVGVANGTSQAAAYVAGLAAAMIGHFPDAYRTPEFVKKRLQVTSRPLRSGADSTLHQDAGKLAAGIVDPILALLDPSQSWVKDGGGWRSVKVRSWPAGMLPFTNANGADVGLKGFHILRIVKTHDNGVRRRWSVYADLNRMRMREEGGAVERKDLLTVPAGAELTLCDGSRLGFEDISDFIPAMKGVTQDACVSQTSSVPPRTPP